LIAALWEKLDVQPEQSPFAELKRTARRRMLLLLFVTAAAAHRCAEGNFPICVQIDASCNRYMSFLGLNAHATHVKHSFCTESTSTNVYARLYRPLGQLHGTAWQS
jgi:hypothetical protein